MLKFHLLLNKTGSGSNAKILIFQVNANNYKMVSEMRLTTSPNKVVVFKLKK